MFRFLKDKLRLALARRANKVFLSLGWINSEAIVNERPKSNKRVVFVIPAIAKGSGGHTSVLRLGTYLSGHGHSVFYAVRNCDIDEQNSQAGECLKNYGGKIVLFSDIENEKFDIIIATDVQSVYYAKKLNGYKMIFVQDYEPLFFETGDYSYIAERVYRMGFHLVSLGEWNKQMIRTHIDENLQVDTIPFPYEKSEYTYEERDYSALKDKKELKLCVYIRRTPRRMPGLCQLIAKNLTERFAADGIKLNVIYFGEDTLKYEYGKNCGKLSKEQLNCLYHECDLGLVASGTNISLVPYEMMATGLPIIEFKGGSFPYFFGEDDAFMFDLNYDELYADIKHAIDEPQILVDRDKRIREKLDGLSWNDSAEKFRHILENLVING